MRKYEIARDLGRAEQYIDELTKDAIAKRPEPTPFIEADPVSMTFVQADDEHAARVAILAVAFMLKNRADALDVSEGSHVERVLEEYKRSSRYVEMLGPVTDDERAAAVALWEETAA